MLMEKQKVLTDAPGALNRPDQPWEAVIEGDSIVARWKWMDATFFSPMDITNAVKEYSFTVKLNDNGKYVETDKTEQKSMGVGFSGGKVKFGSSSNTFMGKTSQKSFQFGIGKNNQTGDVGIIGFKFDTSAVKQPIREYLAACGWENSGLGATSQMGSKSSKIVIRALYVVFLLIACFVFVDFYKTKQFTEGDLKRWHDAMATVTESKVTDENLVKSQKKDTSSNRNVTIMKYTVRYAYTAEFNAWDKLFSFEYKGVNSGEANANATKIPDSAYRFPKKGDTLGVIFDPDAKDTYKIGSKEEWQKKGEVSFANLVFPCVFLAVAVILIIIDFAFIRKKRTDTQTSNS